MELKSAPVSAHRCHKTAIGTVSFPSLPFPCHRDLTPALPGHLAGKQRKHLVLVKHVVQQAKVFQHLDVQRHLSWDARQSTPAPSPAPARGGSGPSGRTVQAVAAKREDKGGKFKRVVLRLGGTSRVVSYRIVSAHDVNDTTAANGGMVKVPLPLQQRQQPRAIFNLDAGPQDIHPPLHTPYPQRTTTCKNRPESRTHEYRKKHNAHHRLHSRHLITIVTIASGSTRREGEG